MRADAALALGATASEATHFAGAQALLQFWRDARYDSGSSAAGGGTGGGTGAPRPNCFADAAEYVVLRAVPAALALVRTQAG